MAEPITYHLVRLVDLLQVPVERREKCIKEVLLTLNLAELADAELDGLIEWTDDDDMTCSLVDENGDAHLTLEVHHD